MAIPIIKTCFNAGELSPSLFGHTDFAKYPLGASTMRNMFVSYRGGANSRAGTAFVGFSKQTGRTYPPRLIPFQFSLSQGIVLEFGHYYMRPIINGAYAVDVTLPISAVTNANPCQITMPWDVAFSATANNAAVLSSYAPGDLIPLAGGNFATQAVLSVPATTVLKATVGSPGTGGFAPGDYLSPVGGNQTTAAEFQVALTQAVAATVVSGGSGGTPGAVTITGTTGTGTKFTAHGTINGSGALTGPLTVATGGAYSVNPTTGYYASAVSINAAKVTASYSAGDVLTLTGGTVTGTTPPSGGTIHTQLAVTNTTLLSCVVSAAGTGYAPADSIGLAGGTQVTTTTPTLGVQSGSTTTTTAPVVATVQVATTQVVTAAVKNGGSGTCANGTYCVTGTTGGPGQRAVFDVTVSGNVVTAVSIKNAGSYAVNPSSLTAEPVIGTTFAGDSNAALPGTLTGVTLTLTMGVATVTVATGGVFTSNPPSAGVAFTQASTTGSGTGATFQTALMVPNAVTIQTAGSYAAVPTNPIAATGGAGIGCTFNINWAGPNSNLSQEPVTGGGLTGATVALSMGVDTVTITNGGVFAVNPPGYTFTQGWTSGTGAGVTFVGALMGPASLAVATPGTYTSPPASPVSQAVDPASGGTGATFTVIFYGAGNLSAGDWVQVDLPGMPSLNGRTLVLQSVGSTAATLSDVYGNPIDATQAGTYTGGGSVARLYTLTTPYAEADLPWIKWAQSADEMSLCCWNQDSGASYPTYDMTRLADNNWSLVAPTFQATIAAPTGLIGTASGSGTTDFQYQVTAVSNADGSESVGSVVVDVPDAVDITSTAGTISIGWNSVAGAASYNIYRASPGYGTEVPAGSLFGFIGTSTGTQFIDSNIIPDFSQVPPTHQNPLANNPPSVVAYFQDRRFYAASPENPDTYWASKPGSYTNFDSRIPSIADDSLSGTPWSVQVNGLQFMLQMLGGLVVLTGQDAWLLNGTGSSATVAAPLTPSSQQVTPQAYNGCSPTIPPIKIEHDILYVQSLGSIVRDLAYNFWVGVFTGSDLTQLSSHLFNDFTLVQWAYAEEPYKVVWAVRNDGALLSLTFLKQQEVAGWARHDTQGAFKSVTAVREPPVTAVYTAVQRVTPASSQAYLIERFDNRLWTAAEDCWCVDAGLANIQPAPAATLTVGSPTGLGACSGVTGLVGGAGYSAQTTATVVDANGSGPGSGAVVALTITNGAIVAVSFPNPGSGYVYPELVFNDPAGTGSGAAASVTLNNTAAWSASTGVFSAASVGSAIRVGGGIAVITGVFGATQVTVNVLSPVIETIPNAPFPMCAPFLPGSWTLTAPLSTVYGLGHLEGMWVTGLADGNVIPLTQVQNGSITLSQPATAIIVGLGFRAQLQTMPLDMGQPTVQGQRKKVAAVTARVEATRGIKAGANQPDGSTLSPMRLDGGWAQMVPVPDLGGSAYNAPAQSLYTGDVRVPLFGGFAKQGQICFQQDNPLPMNILAVIPEVDPGDMPQPPGPVARQQRR